MATTTVYDLINRCKTQLMETGTEGRRWANAEALVWLNEFYQFACMHLPERFSEVRSFACVAGTRQSLPPDMTQLLDVTRNLGASKRVITRFVRNELDNTRPEWHSEAAGSVIEGWCLDDMFPTTFYVSPPASSGTQIEIAGSVVPTAHDMDDYTGQDAVIKCPDYMVPAAVDYILSRCYSKDAAYTGNAQREANHLNRCLALLGIERQVRMTTSPNNPMNNGQGQS